MVGISMRVFVLIPGYNEETAIGPVIEAAASYVERVVVMDDGSSDATGEIARERGAVVLRHVLNRGLGAALGTGFAYAREEGADIAITLDADGQHDPREIPLFIEAISAGADVVIGSRMLDAEGMPWYRQIANWLGNVTTFVLFGAWVTDSQSGFRALGAEALDCIDVRTNRMEVSSEIIAEARRNRLNLVEVPIRAIYTDYSLSKGQSFTEGLRTLLKLLLRRVSTWV